MRKGITRIAAVTLAAVLTVSLTRISVVPVFGATGDKRDQSDEIIAEIADQFADPSNDPFDFTQKSARKKLVSNAKGLPAVFDLRDVGGESYVTHVKLQNPFGNCWGFAAVSAAETSILGDSDHITSLTSDTMDLSEKHLSFFAATPIDDPDNPQNGEGVIGGSDVSDRYDLGGMAPTATSLFAQGVGPVLESENELFVYKGVKGLVTKDEINGVLANYCYSPNDDWTIPESLRFNHTFFLKESYMLPSPAIIDEGNIDSSYEYNPAGTAAIKEQLYQKRGVQIGYWDDTFNPVLDECGEFISSKWAQYTYMLRGPRHAVCIVGCDDNYPRENFIEGHQPPEDLFPDGRHEGAKDGGNGAWLVKNSWGSGEEPFPNKGEGLWGLLQGQDDYNSSDAQEEHYAAKSDIHTGYFWLSYYDQSIATPEALDFEKSSTEDTRVTDQHDYMPVKEVYAANVEDAVSMANVFEAGVCQELQQVSCLTSYPNTEVTFDIYLLSKDFSTPVDGLLMDRVTETFDYGGFHRIKLNKPFMVMKGQSYSIVVTQKTPEGKYAVNAQTAYGGREDDPCALGVINKGESYLLTGDTWNDFSKKELQNSLLVKAERSTDEMQVDNFPIKGFGEKKPNLVMKLGSNGAPIPPFPGEEPEPSYFLLNIEGDADAAIPDNMKLEWKLNEGADDILTMKDGRTANRKTFYGKKVGRVRLTVTAEGIGTIIYPINITIPGCYIQELKTGKESLDLTLMDISFTGIEGYEVSYRVKGSSSWKTVQFGPESTMVSLSGLNTEKQYEVKARAWTTDSFGKYYGPYGEIKLSDAKEGTSTLKVSPKKLKVKARALKKKDVTFKRATVMKVSGAKGKVTYKIVSVTKKKFKKKFKINKKTGKLRVKKGLGKGTYKVKIKVRDAGTGSHKAVSKTVTVKVTVK